MQETQSLEIMSEMKLAPPFHDVTTPHQSQ